MSLCRICLENGATLPLFEDKPVSVSILYKMFVCFGEQVKNQEGYPQKVCETCYNSLESAYNFIHQFRESCKVLERNIEIVIKTEPMLLQVPSADTNCVKYIKKELFEEVECESFEQIESSVDENLELKSKLEVDIDEEELVMPKVKLEVDIDEEELVMPKVKLEVDIDEEELVMPKAEHPHAIKETYSSQDCDFNEVKHVNSKQMCIKNPRIKKTVTKDKTASRIHPTTKNKSVESSYNDSSLLDEEFTWKEECSPDMSEKEEKPESKKETRPQKRKKERDKKPMTKKKAGDKPGICYHCGKWFRRGSDLKEHLMFEENKQQFECSLCLKTFNSSRNLKLHRDRAHNEKERTFVCEECGAAFPYRKDLKSHKKRVHDEQFKQKRPFGCKTCGKTFKTNVQLLVHTRSAHTGERPAVCDVCDAKFFHERYLVQHRRLHTGDTPFKCPICSRGYAQLGNMLSHVKHNHRKSQVDDKVLGTLKPCVLKVMKS